MNIQPLEPLEIINERLLSYYGDINSQPKFRVVWSEDQVENVFTDKTPEGLILPTKRIITRKKYGYLSNLYILEKITPVPEENQEEVGRKLSYEPLWVFQDNEGNALPPIWDAIIVILNTLTDILNHIKGEGTSDAKYPMPESEWQTTEAIEEKAKKLEEVLFGNESGLGDSLSQGTAVGFGSRQRDDTRFNSNSIKQ